jgi:hypothetical protein
LLLKHVLVFTAVFYSLTGWLVSAAGSESDARTSYEGLIGKIPAITTDFLYAVQYPNDSKSRELPKKLDQLADQFKALPNPPLLPTVACAERDRSIAFLLIAKARYYGASETAEIDYKRERFELASAALGEIKSSRSWLARALEPSDPDFSPEMKSAIEKSHINDNLSALAATAYSIIWVVKNDAAAKNAARTEWTNVSGDYRRDYYPPAPEVMTTLDLGPQKPITGAMTAIAWVGVGLIVLALIAAIFVSKADLFQQWAVRVVFAIGAAMAATVITGLLNINLPKWGIVAGGALGIIVLIYLFNPPAINPPPPPTSDPSRNP